MKNKLITILARKGSKGLPDKNMKDMNGQPLINWTFFQAINFEEADIVVSTDYEGMKHFCNTYGVYHHDRDPKLAQDDTPKIEAIREAVSAAEVEYGEKYDIVIDLDVSAPLRTEINIHEAVGMHEMMNKRSTLDVVFSVSPARKNPYFNMVTTDRFGQSKTACEGDYLRRQDAPPIHEMNASIYVYNKKWLDKGINNVLNSKNYPLYMEDWQAFDIDSEVDFQIAEMLHKKYILDKEG